MRNKPLIVGRVVASFAVIFLVTSNASSAQAQGLETGTKALSGGVHTTASQSLAGKTVWIVDVNSNESYHSTLQAAIVDQLPQHAPGAIVRHVTTSEKGNPFFLLRRENYPDVAIISLGVCADTTKNVANYASEARKKGIPSVICYLGNVSDYQEKWNKAYRIPDVRAIEIEEMPQSPQEAEPVAKRLLPMIIERLKD